MKILLIVSACFSAALALSSGPPTRACDGMVPDHGNPTVSGPAPYNITVDSMTYSQGSSIQVTVMGGTTFKGFFVQARVNDNSFATNMPVGMFSDFPAGTQGIECTNTDAAWGHSNADDKTEVQATWNYDGDCTDIGDIAFRMTVVQGDPRTRYYTEIMSDSLMFDQSQCDGGDDPEDAAGYLVYSLFTLVASTITAILM